MLHPDLDPRQSALLAHWLPGAELVADLSWPARLTTVLHVRAADGDAVVKAAGPVMRGHVARELRAGRVLRGTQVDPGLLAGDAAAHLVCSATGRASSWRARPPRSSPTCTRPSAS